MMRRQALKCRTFLKTLNLKSVIKLCAFLLMIFSALWIYRASVKHLFLYVSDPVYKECVLRRQQAAELDLNQSKKAPLYITLRQRGRLGNWLFSYASLLGIARVNGYIPYITQYHPLTNGFSVSNIRSRHAECLLTVTDPLPCGFSSTFSHLPKANISIDGYVQSWKYFKDMEPLIRKEFKVLPGLFLESKRLFHQKLGKYLMEGRTAISIHVRRGDMASQEAHSLGFIEAPKSFFENAMKYMLKKHPHSVFYVVSEIGDKNWCQENIKSPIVRYWVDRDTDQVINDHVDVVVRNEKDFATTKQNIKKEKKYLMRVGGIGSFVSEEVPVLYFSTYSAPIDFGLLIQANHSIISVGTFGWWGAWVANGDAMYYKDYPIKGSKINNEMVKEDFYPSHWIALSCSNTFRFHGIAVWIPLLNIIHFSFML